MANLIDRDAFVTKLANMRQEAFANSSTAEGKNDLDCDQWEEYGDYLQDIINLIEAEPSVETEG